MKPHRRGQNTTSALARLRCSEPRDLQWGRGVGGYTCRHEVEVPEVPYRVSGLRGQSEREAGAEDPGLAGLGACETPLDPVWACHFEGVGREAQWGMD
jgi:hypothetical protein